MRVVIVGAGLSGLTLAAMLRRVNVNCVVIERMPDLDSLYQPPITLWSNALNCLSAFDLPTLLNYHSPNLVPESHFGIRRPPRGAARREGAAYTPDPDDGELATPSPAQLVSPPPRWLLRMHNRSVQQPMMDEADMIPAAVAPSSTSESLVSRVVLEEIKKELAVFRCVTPLAPDA